MNTQPITVVGTPQGFWTRWVDQFLFRLEHTSVHADLDSSDALDTVLGRAGEARTLVLVEHPATGLARMLIGGTGADPQAWLDEWLAGSRALLSHARRRPDECLLVNADDARRSPRKLAELMRSCWGEDVDAPADLGQGFQPDPLANALAVGLVDRNPAVQDVAEELLASCRILPGDEGLFSALGPRTGADPAAAARRLGQLVGVEKELDAGLRALRTEAAMLRGRVDTVQAACEALDQERAALRERLAQSEAMRESLALDLATERAGAQSLRDELVQKDRHHLRVVEQELRAAKEAAQARADEAGSRFASLAAENESLRRDAAFARSRFEELEQRSTRAMADQLALQDRLTAQEELCRAQARQLSDERARADRSSGDVDHLRGHLEQLEGQRSRLEDALRDAEEEGVLLHRQLAEIQAALEQLLEARAADEARVAELRDAAAEDRLRSELAAVRDERELFALQSDQLQREVERLHADNLRLSRTMESLVVAPGFEDVAIGELRVIGERDTPPHREVSFVLRDVSVGSRTTAEARVRLVEHWGRPGLAIFADDGAPPLVASWVESGREDGRPYMLLVHGEEATQRLLDRMGTHDWQTLQAVVLRIQQAAFGSRSDLAPVWRSVAQRLLQSLQEHPARLRFQGVTVMPIEQGSPEVARWALCLERASFRGRTWPRLTIQWRPVGARPSLMFVQDEEGGPPLLAWPADEDGHPVRALRLPLGDVGSDDPEARAAWHGLLQADKGFVAEVLNLLPTLAVHIQASTGDSAPASANGADLQAAARAAVLFGRAALCPVPPAVPQPSAGRRILQRVYRKLRAPDADRHGAAGTLEATR